LDQPDIPETINLSKMSPREQELHKSHIALLKDSKYATQIASYDNYIKQRIRMNSSTNEGGDSTIESKTRSLLQNQYNSKVQESLFSATNENTIHDKSRSPRDNNLATSPTDRSNGLSKLKLHERSLMINSNNKLIDKNMSYRDTMRSPSD